MNFNTLEELSCQIICLGILINVLEKQSIPPEKIQQINGGVQIFGKELQKK